MGSSFSPAFDGAVGVSAVFCWGKFIFSTVTLPDGVWVRLVRALITTIFVATLAGLPACFNA